MSEFDTEFSENNSDTADNYVKRSLYTCYFVISYYLMAEITIKLFLAVGAVLLFVTLAVLVIKTRANIREVKLDLSSALKKDKKLLEQKENRIRKKAAKKAKKDLDVIEKVKEEQEKKLLKQQLRKRKGQN
jgi:hypothetical protein